MKKKIIFCAIVLWIKGMVPLFSQTEIRYGEISGRVMDAETQSPLIGANVSIENTALGAATDRNGRFVIPRVPVGNYNLRFGYIGYESLIQADVIVKSTRTTAVHAGLKMQAVETEAVSVTAGYFSASKEQPVSAIQFSSEEIRRAPGSGGDVSRILLSLPGVAKVNDQSNALCVRGGNPIENTFYIDNIEIPNINHFPDQATSSGPIGLVNVDFIEDVAFYAGGFSAAYGDRLSSIMDMTFREGNRNGFEGQLDLNFAGFGGAGEGPLGSKGSWMVSARRSYLDLVVQTIDVGSTVSPRYGDVQGKIVVDLNPRHKLILLGVFGDDHNAPDRETGVENDMIHYGNQDDFQRTIGMNWRALWSRNGYSNTSLSMTSQDFEQDWYETSTGAYMIRNRSHERTMQFRNVNHFRLHSRHAATFGVESKWLRDAYDNWYGASTNATGGTIPEQTLRESLHGSKVGGFVSYEVRPISRLSVTAGLRGDGFSYNKHTAWSPRAALSYQLSERMTLSGSAGLYYQNMPLLLLSRHEDNKKLRDPRAAHLILGFEHLLTADTRLTLEVYQKTYDHFPTDPAQPGVFLLDEGYTFNQTSLVDEGKARARGIEIMLQKKLAKDFYGLASASLSRAEYRGLDGRWRDRKYDNRVMVGVEGGYKPNKNWEFSLRWIYAGGAPYTPLDIDASRRAHRIVFDEQRINAARFPDYHSMNIRFDRRFHFSRTNLIFYLSVWNVYNRKNVAMVFWNDAEQKQDVIYQWLALPIFGLEYEF